MASWLCSGSLNATRFSINDSSVWLARARPCHNNGIAPSRVQTKQASNAQLLAGDLKRLVGLQGFCLDFLGLWTFFLVWWLAFLP